MTRILFRNLCLEQDVLVAFLYNLRVLIAFPVCHLTFATDYSELSNRKRKIKKCT